MKLKNSYIAAIYIICRLVHQETLNEIIQADSISQVILRDNENIHLSKVKCKPQKKKQKKILIGRFRNAYNSKYPLII